MNSPLSAPPILSRAVKVLLITLGVAFVLQLGLRQFAGIPVEQLLGFSPSRFVNGFFWQILSYPFLHGGLTHLLFNCLILYALGSELERRWGTITFLKFYGVCAIGGALLQTLIWAGALFFAPGFADSLGNIPIIGASGALYGLFIAFGMLYSNSIVLAFFIVPMKAKHFVALLATIEIVSVVFSGSGATGGGVAHLVHLGGLVTGFIYLKLKGPNLRGGGSGGLFKKKKSMDREEIKRRLSVVVNNEPERGDKNYPITWN